MESLNFLNINRIQKIYLISNEICSVKSLNKTKWPNLKVLNLAWNYIHEGSLEKVKTDKQIKNFSFNMNPLAGKQLNFFVKLEA